MQIIKIGLHFIDIVGFYIILLLGTLTKEKNRISNYPENAASIFSDYLSISAND
jgi:hypothetical protein